MHPIGLSENDKQCNRMEAMHNPRSVRMLLVERDGRGLILAMIAITMVSCTTIECACIEDRARRMQCEVDVDRAKRKGEMPRTDCVSADDQKGRRHVMIGADISAN
jgi:hypothetical protein